MSEEKKEKNELNETTESKTKINSKEETNNDKNNEKENITKEKEDNKTSEEMKSEGNSNTYKESSEPFMQILTKELIPCLNDIENQKCFDCGASPANWVCVSNAIFLCGKCAGEHRSYGPIISNLKFMMLDKLNEFEIEIMKIGGNKALDNLLQSYNFDKNKMDKLILYSTRLLEYYRDFLYNKLAGKEEPQKVSKFSANDVMQFKDNPRPPLEKVVIKQEKKNTNNNSSNDSKDNKKKNCGVQ